MNTTDLVGKKFGKLTVIKFDRVEYKRDAKGKNRDRGYWLCRCDCGKKVTNARNDLVSGKTKSCGCLCKENAIKNRKRNFIDLTGKKINELKVINIEKVE